MLHVVVGFLMLLVFSKLDELWHFHIRRRSSQLFRYQPQRSGNSLWELTRFHLLDSWDRTPILSLHGKLSFLLNHLSGSLALFKSNFFSSKQKKCTQQHNVHTCNQTFTRLFLTVMKAVWQSIVRQDLQVCKQG